MRYAGDHLPHSDSFRFLDIKRSESRLSRAPTMSSRAETCEIAHPLAAHQRIRVPPVCHAKCVNQDIAVDQVRHVNHLLGSWRRCSAPKIASKIVDVFDTIADVGAILPHPVDRKIPNRAGFALESVCV